MLNRSGDSGKRSWLKAAVVGSSWASFEIIVGSFLHNMRLPFAGMLLSAASVLLLTAFMQLWPQRGLLIRAGLVCALMKSVSPSALVFGPMIGITMEALIMEMVLWAAPKNLLLILLAGGLAVLWSLVQKILNLIVLYGLNLIQIADSLYSYLVKITGLHAFSLTELLWLAGGFYFLLGMSAAASGFYLGKSYFNQQNMRQPEIVLSNDSGFTEPNQHPKPRAIILPLLLGAVIFILMLFNLKYYLVAVLSGLLFATGVLVRYRQALKRLAKPGVWIQFVLITLVASLLLEGVNNSNGFSGKGLLIGLEMVFRAVMLIFAFSALAVELRNPVLKALLHRHGFSKLYQASTLAFSALPALIAALPAWKTVAGSPRQVIWQVLGRSEQLLKQFDGNRRNSFVLIITGEVHQGKTTFLAQLLQAMQARGIPTAGFLSKAVPCENGKRAYELEFFPSGELQSLAVEEPREGWQTFRRYSFNPLAWEAGSKLLIEASTGKNTWLVLDELGPMEVEGLGWHKLTNRLLKLQHPKMIWVVRKNQLDAIIAEFKPENIRIVDIQLTTPSEVVSSLPV